MVELSSERTSSLEKKGSVETSFFIYREIPPKMKETLKFLGMVYSQSATDSEKEKED